VRVVPHAQHTEGWYAARLGIPTASRFAHVLAQGKGNAPSLTRQKYVVELALERITGRREELKPTEAMDVGTEREPLARQAYMVRTGELVSEAGLCLHDTLDCGASPDGWIGDGGLLELKCPQPLAHLDYLRLPSDKCPSKYVPQIQGQLWITGRQWCDFMSYNPDFPEGAQTALRRVHADPAYHVQLELAIRLFLADVAEEQQFIENYREAA
jgi:hypothetical protein